MTSKIIAAGCAASLALANPVQSQEMDGSLTFGMAADQYFNTDDDVGGGVLSFDGSGHLTKDIAGFQMTIDAALHRLLTPIEDVFDDASPTALGALGVHVGKPTQNGYLGVFAGINAYEAYSDFTSVPLVFSDLTSKTGYLFGVEGTGEIDFARYFWQLGTAKMEGDSYDGDLDTAFDGAFFKVGLRKASPLGDVFASLEAGSSPNIYEDEGDSGYYQVVNLGLEFPLSDRLTATAGIERQAFTANTEDFASVDRFYFSVRMPIGRGGAWDLQTTQMPGRAAAWAEVLD